MWTIYACDCGERICERVSKHACVVKPYRERESEWDIDFHIEMQLKMKLCGRHDDINITYKHLSLSLSLNFSFFHMNGNGQITGRKITSLRLKAPRSFFICFVLFNNYLSFIFIFFYPLMEISLILYASPEHCFSFMDVPIFTIFNRRMIPLRVWSKCNENQHNRYKFVSADI